MTTPTFAGRVQRADNDAWVDLSTAVVTTTTTADGTIYIVSDPADSYELFRGVLTPSAEWVAAAATRAAGRTVGAP